MGRDRLSLRPIASARNCLYTRAMSSLKLLALDSSSDACTVAISTEGQLVHRHVVEPRIHAARMLELIVELCEQTGVGLSELDGLVVGRGPGSFTGVRIGVSIAQGLALGAELMILPVSSLEAMAYGAAEKYQATRVVAGYDARMGEIYIGAWSFDDLIKPVVTEQVCPPTALSLPSGAWVGVGSAFASYADELRQQNVSWLTIDGEFVPDARWLLALALQRWPTGQILPEHLEPAYLRNQVAHRS